MLKIIYTKSVVMEKSDFYNAFVDLIRIIGNKLFYLTS